MMLSLSIDNLYILGYIEYDDGIMTSTLGRVLMVSPLVVLVGRPGHLFNLQYFSYAL